MINVGVLGAKGRMGTQVCSTVESASDLTLAAQVDVGDSLDQLAGADVVVDFTHPGAVMDNLRWCVEHGIASVVGTSGFDDNRLREVAGWLADRPAARVLIVPNFSVGAVLMMRFAALAAPFFESAEVIELHHAGKADAPSGTASRTASVISAARAAAGDRPDAGCDSDRCRRRARRRGRRRPCPLGAPRWPARASGGPARRARRDPDDPA